MEGKIPDARGRTWDLKNKVTELPGPGFASDAYTTSMLNAKTGWSRSIARQILQQDTRLKLKPEELYSLRTGAKGVDPLELMKKYYGRSVGNLDEFLDYAEIRNPDAIKDIATRVLSEVELIPKFAEGGLAEILQTPRRGRVTHPGGYSGSKWTKLFRDLGKEGGSTKDFSSLYSKMKSQAVPIDPFEALTIHEMLMSGALPSELKHGGLARILEV